jgi:hypothetical protein
MTLLLNLKRRTYELKTFHLQADHLSGHPEDRGCHKKIGVYCPDFEDEREPSQWLMRVNPGARRRHRSSGDSGYYDRNGELNWAPAQFIRKRQATFVCSTSKKGSRAMVTKTKGKATKKKGKKGRIKTLKLKREAVKDLTGGEQKKIKGGGGVAGGVVLRGT